MFFSVYIYMYLSASEKLRFLYHFLITGIFQEYIQLLQIHIHIIAYLTKKMLELKINRKVVWDKLKIFAMKYICPQKHINFDRQNVLTFSFEVVFLSKRRKPTWLSSNGLLNHQRLKPLNYTFSKQRLQSKGA